MPSSRSSIALNIYRDVTLPDQHNNAQQPQQLNESSRPLRSLLSTARHLSSESPPPSPCYCKRAPRFSAAAAAPATEQWEHISAAAALVATSSAEQPWLLQSANTGHSCCTKTSYRFVVDVTHRSAVIFAGVYTNAAKRLFVTVYRSHWRRKMLQATSSRDTMTSCWRKLIASVALLSLVACCVSATTVEPTASGTYTWTNSIVFVCLFYCLPRRLRYRSSY